MLMRLRSERREESREWGSCAMFLSQPQRGTTLQGLLWIPHLHSHRDNDQQPGQDFRPEVEHGERECRGPDHTNKAH
ncbi:hypothetical protein MHYP_G00148790 [Metynnis hypsauchen]